MKKYYILLVSLCLLLGTFSCSDDYDYKGDNSIYDNVTVEIEGAQNGLLGLPFYNPEPIIALVKPDLEIALDPKSFAYAVEINGVDTLFTVNEKGEVKVKKEGTAKLTVTLRANNSKTATYMVTIIGVPITEMYIPDTVVTKIKPLDTVALKPPLIVVKPVSATNQTLIYESDNPAVATVDAEGIVRAIAVGVANIKMTTTDGSNITYTHKVSVGGDLVRTAWSVSVSHALPSDANFVNAPESLVDGDNVSALALVKPGKNYGGVNVPAADAVYFIIDMKEQKEFNYFRLRHKSANLTLRVHGASLFGSNDGITFTPIVEDLVVPGFNDNKITITEDIYVPKTKFQYFKFEYKKWATAASTMQISEFYLGIFE